MGDDRRVMLLGALQALIGGACDALMQRQVAALKREQEARAWWRRYRSERRQLPGRQPAALPAPD